MSDVDGATSTHLPHSEHTRSATRPFASSSVQNRKLPSSPSALEYDAQPPNPAFHVSRGAKQAGTGSVGLVDGVPVAGRTLGVSVRAPVGGSSVVVVVITHGPGAAVTVARAPEPSDNAAGVSLDAAVIAFG